MQVRQLTSPDEVRSVAAAWDRLWQRSEVSQPLVRAELVAQWLEHFCPRADIRVLVVEDGSELAAAIPLVGHRQRGVLPVGDLTGNEWSPSGDLLLDPAYAPEDVFAPLIAGLNRLPWHLLWLDRVPLETSYWQELLRILSNAGASVDVHPRYRVGGIEVCDDCETYESHLSKGLLSDLRRSLRRLEQEGPVELSIFADRKPEDVDMRLREAFEVEERSWKTTHGQTVLRTLGMFDYYCREARQLAEWGMLRVAFLEQAGRPIASVVGWIGKSVYHGCKLSYDESYRKYAPGNLLMWLMNRHLFREPGVRWHDFQGPLTEGLARWATNSYPIGRVVVASRGLTSRTLFTAYRIVAPALRFLKRQLRRSQ